MPTPQPWQQPPPVYPQPPKRGGNTGLIVAVVVVVLLAVAGGGWFVWHRLSATPTDTAAVSHSPTSAPAGSASAGSASAGSPEAGGKTLVPGGRPGSASPPSHSASPAPDPEQAALSRLQAIRDESLGRAPLDGRWVAQVQSKSVGITDPLQTAANGTHTFYATDILAELQNIQATVGTSANLYLVWGTDFGKRSTAADGSPYWTTLADAGFAGEDDVNSWCAATFPGLSADQLADQCTPRQLNPPHD